MDSFGDQSLFTNQEAGLVQVLGDGLAPNTRYTLRVQVGNIADDPAPPHGSFQFAGFPGYRVDLLAGGAILDSDDAGPVPPEGGFLESTVEVEVGGSHARLGAPLAIRLVNLNAAPGLEVNFDHVRLDAFDTAPWADLGQAKAGVSGPPRLLGGGPLTAGSENRLDLRDAAPSSIATLIVGTAAANVPLLAGLLVPSPQLFVPLPTDAAGATALPFVWPSVPAATALYFQAWVQGASASFGYSASNGLVGLSG